MCFIQGRHVAADARATRILKLKEAAPASAAMQQLLQTARRIMCDGNYVSVNALADVVADECGCYDLAARRAAKQALELAAPVEAVRVPPSVALIGMFA